MTFTFYPLRLQFRAVDVVRFPGGKAANVLRGAFGCVFRQLACDPACPGTAACPRRDSCPYAAVFEPESRGVGPSGLADLPRPFVFRARSVDGRAVSPGDDFHFDLNVFHSDPRTAALFILTFARIGEQGLGPGRGRAHLTNASLLGLDGQPGAPLYRDGILLHEPFQPVQFPLAAEPAARLRIEFLTPTELKVDGGLAATPEFPALFARARDRVSTLRALYGAGPLDADFRALGERAGQVRRIHCDVRRVDVSRRSSRTGQTHSLGGFTGSATYEGHLDEFVPYLRAAIWTGVGRQTVWGKGEIAVTVPVVY
ncbi:MAG: CRISPR system precrRNA processing endoribonuclease RAMP protein Cas6 [Bryobacterales bacterium]|nr:CRISPR system precrRNA processing endoribonuclease RAMP protein Cas6 [Bryobacterales bacterium]